MTQHLKSQIDALPEATRRRLEEAGFEVGWFLHQAERLAEVGSRDNHVQGTITPPGEGDVLDLPTVGSEERSRLTDEGTRHLASGHCALVVLAGGMATRMGGVVKALVEAVPGKTFLDLRLAGHRALEEQAGRRIPFWLMTSHATDEAVRQALGDQLDGYHIATFPQMVSLRLNPDGSLFLDEEGNPSDHSPGHGDLPDALRRSGLLDRFIEEEGRYVTTANLDNIGATLDPALTAMHARSRKPMMCEVVDKEGTDKGGIPARLDGQPLILEEFRIPPTFDPSQVRMFNTNTFHFDAEALRNLSMEWTYFIVEKEVDGRPAIQFERIINEVAGHLPATFVRVPRHAPESRFMPIKDREQLAAKRADLEAVATARGML